MQRPPDARQALTRTFGDAFFTAVLNDADRITIAAKNLMFRQKRCKAGHFGYGMIDIDDISTGFYHHGQDRGGVATNMQLGQTHRGNG